MSTDTSSIINPTVNSAANAAANAATNAATSSIGSTAAAAQQGLNGTYQEFLKLLTTELNNQDPTAPMDPTQMVGQLASLSQVEQQIGTNSNLQQLISLFSANQINNAVSYIGKQVDASGNQVTLANSQAALVYTLPAGASSATVTITNSAGQTVFSGAGTTIAGRNQVMWNGANSATGAAMPDGVYNFTVVAKDSGGNPLTATTSTTGTVTAVDTQNGSASLSLGSISVPIGNVQSVYNPGTNPGA
ncbi:MAG: flagellar hook assembly protein FlgD [Pseudomonadota bacterium]|nr:flagellar hook assembly protein FlgD [Pseudomonadota bacterium]MDE3037463.1 flagellar hook assembly protein FlgD [Pseudomonadota bacterium]